MPLPTLPLWNPVSRKREVKRLVRLADAARDAKRWPEAAQAYKEALALDPDGAGIWVQLGHAEKESGRFHEAEAAYFRADALRPNDADLHVQLGHLSKLRGNAAAAESYYARARELGSTDPAARGPAAPATARAAAGAARAVSPGAGAGAGAGASRGTAAELPAATTIFLDVSDLLLHFRHNRFPTGIQRVQIELFRASLDWRGAAEIRTVVFSHNPQFWAELEPISFNRLCDMASSPGSKDDPDWQDASRSFIQKLEAQPACRMPRGSIVLNVGTSWWMPNYMQVVREAKARLGIAYVPFVHDLVPMKVPEFLDGNLGPVFAAWISSVYLHADGLAVNSRNTLRDLEAAAGAVRPLRHAPTVMRLDAQSTPPAASAPSAGEQRRLLEGFGVSAGSYVLFVGTFEARKNHLMAFQAWSRLIQQHGRNNVPTLLCVGKRGWRFDAADHYLNSHPELAGKVMLVSGVSDAELQSLYLGCRFTLYNSVYEGWGLPVTESLGYGKACLVPNHSSLPEAGGDLADYYDGGSLASLVDGAARLMLDEAYRTGRERRIAAEHRPRSWGAALQELVDGVTKQVSLPPAADTFCAPVRWNASYALQLHPDQRGPDLDNAVAEMLRAGNHWHEIDGWGVWSKFQTATLAFLVPELGASDSDATLMLRVHAASEPVHVTVGLGGNVLETLALGAGASRLLHLALPFAALAELRRRNAPATLRLHVDKLAPASIHGERKPAGIGVSLFALSRVDDVAGRLGLLENAVLTTLVAHAE